MTFRIWISQSADEIPPSASSALSNVEKVDIEGGWKVGDKFVVFGVSLEISLSC